MPATGAAVVRADGVREGRRLLVEAELHATGRDRVQVNGQPLRRTRDLLGAFCVTVFAPDDLELVKGGPQGRRQYLDDLLVALHPRHDVTISEVERVLKQRNALLKSAGPSAGGAVAHCPPISAHTLDVWDASSASWGRRWRPPGRRSPPSLEPLVGAAYGRLADAGGPPGSGAIQPGLPAQLGRRSRSTLWSGPVATICGAGVTTVGPAS